MKKLLALALLGSLSACGGGGGSPGPGELPPASTPSTSPWGAQGLWKGVADDRRTVTGWTLPDGTYWWLYSKAGNPEMLGGVFQGNFVAMNGSYSSTSGHDFNLELLGVRPLSVTGSYTEKASFGGFGVIPAATANGVATSFGITMGYDARYETAARVAEVIGYRFTGAVASPLRNTVSAVLSSTASGSLSIVLDDGRLPPDACTLSGTLSTSSASPLIHVVNLTASSGACPFPALRTGSAYFDSDARKLHVIVPGVANADALVFTGTR